MIKKFWRKLTSHKIIFGFLIIIVVGGAAFLYRNSRGAEQETSYIMSAVAKGNLITTISGSGQVSVANQIEVKPKASGDIISISVINGQTVASGQAIAQLNATDALKAVRDAQVNLDSAKLALQKLEQPADNLSVIRAENDLAKAEEAKPNAENDLAKTYEDGFNAVADTFLELPAIMTGLDNILFDEDFNTSQWNIDYYTSRAKQYNDQIQQFADKAMSSYQLARNDYDDNFQSYKDSSRFSDTQTIDDLIDQTYDTAKVIAEAIKDIKNLIDFYENILTKNNQNISSTASTHQSQLEDFTGTTNSNLVDLLSIQDNIRGTKEDIINTDRDIAENKESLANLLSGSDPLDIESQKLTVKQRQNSLLDAQIELGNYTVRAPFAGVIADVPVQRGEAISTGTTVVTLITEQKIAEIFLNEVDVAKIETNQKVTITFDAVEDLIVTGKVADIATIGEITQGVVNYGVLISFDVQDERIKPGMSLSASIITDSKINVVIVPNSAIKSQGNSTYVEIMGSDDTAPTRQQVEIGLNNDTMTEIISGISAGQQVVTQTINGGGSSGSGQSGGNSIIPFRGSGGFRR